MVVLAKDTEVNGMYRRTQKGERGWFARPRQTAKQFIARLEKKGVRVTGRESYMLGEFKQDPSLILFKFHMRGVDSFSGKYETVYPILLKADTRLRKISNKPGYGGDKSRQVANTNLGNSRMTRISAPKPSKVETRRTNVTNSEATPKRDNVSPANPFASLRATPLDSEDVYQDLIDEAITDRKD